jgi:hypothetical protein
MPLNLLRLRFGWLNTDYVVGSLLFFTISQLAFSNSLGPSGNLQDATFPLDSSSIPLSIDGRAKIPLAELSAFASRSDRGVKNGGFIAVGDRGTDVLKFDRIGLLSTLGIDLGSGQSINLAKAMKFHMSECVNNEGAFCKKTIQGLTGQWEGASYDQDGQIWMLQESTESIHVFDQGITERDSIIRISPFNPILKSDDNVTAKDSSSDDNPYEGIHVLSSHEVLLARQHSPSGVALFSVKNGPSQENGGRQPIAKLAIGEKFWHLPKSISKCLLSEIVHFDGYYYLLSSSCKLILKTKLGSSNYVSVVETFSIPSSVGWAEALLVIDEGHFLVGVDTGKNSSDNIFLLSTGTAENPN